MLEAEDLPDVEVGSVEQFQGKEKRRGRIFGYFCEEKFSSGIEMYFSFLEFDSKFFRREMKAYVDSVTCLGHNRN